MHPAKRRPHEPSRPARRRTSLSTHTKTAHTKAAVEPVTGARPVAGLRPSAVVKAMVEAVEPRRLFANVTPLAPLTNLQPQNATPVVVNLRNFFRTDSSSGSAVRLNFLYGTAPSTAVVNLTLFDGSVPRTVANFLSYVETARFDNTFFHRLINGFVLQGGSYSFDGFNVSQVVTDPPIVNEFATSPRDVQGRVNTRGTLSFAKLGGDPDSATSGFFFNLADNSSNLDNQNGGFATFARVTSAADQSALDAVIAAVSVVNAGPPFDTLPVADLTGNTIQLANLVRISSATLVQSGLTFTATSSDPSVVAASLSGGRLTLTRGATAGIATITVTATDRDNATLTSTFTYSTSPPTATVALTGSLTEGSSSAVVSLTNPADPLTGDPASLRYSYDFDNNGTFEVTNTALASVSIPSSFLSDGPATRTLRVRVTDTGGFFRDLTLPFSVSNVAPTATFTATGPSAGPPRVGRPVTLSPTITDPSAADVSAGFNLQWTVTRSGTNVASGSGATLTFTPTDTSTYTATLVATDKDGGASTPFSLDISPLALPTVTVSSPAVPEGSAAATIDLSSPLDPAAGLPQLFTYSVDFNNDGIFEITNSPSTSFVIPAAFVSDGPATRIVRVRITDSQGVTSDVTQTYTAVNLPPTATFSYAGAGVGGMASVGRPVTLTASATDPSPDDQAGPFTFAWTITRHHQGAVQTFATGTGSTFTFTPTEATDFTVNLTATDKDGASSSVSTQVITAVTLPAVTLSVPASIPEGSTTAVLTLSNPLDPLTTTPSSLRYSIDFDNDGTFELTGITFPASGTLAIPAAFVDNGTNLRALRVRVTDTATRFDDFTAGYTITNVPPTASIASPRTRYHVGDSAAFTGSATDPSSADQLAGFIFDWTILRSGTPVATGTGPTFTYVPDAVGAYTARLTARDIDGGVSAPVTLAFSAVPAPTATVSPDLTLPETATGTFTFSNPQNPYDNDTSLLRLSVDFNNDGSFELVSQPLAPITLPANLIADGPITRTVRFRLTDSGGGTGGFTDYTRTVTVTNTPPTASIAVPLSAAARSDVTLVASATDVPADLAAGFSYAWTATDGTSSFQAPSGSTFTFRPPVAGLYTATLTATDKDGATSPLAQVTLNVASAIPQDIAPPALQILAPLGLTTSATSLTLRLALSDPSGIDTDLLPGSSLTLTLPDGTPATATFTGVSTTADVAIASYRFSPPSGTLQPGTYALTLSDPQRYFLRDLASNRVLPPATERFDVSTPSPAGGAGSAAGGPLPGSPSGSAVVPGARVLDSQALPDGRVRVAALDSAGRLLLGVIPADGSAAVFDAPPITLPALASVLSANFDPTTGRLFVTGRDAALTPTLVRLTADGIADTSFGSSGVLTIRPAPGRAGNSLTTASNVLTALTLPRNRGTLIAGQYGVGQSFIARLRPDGSLDPAFASAGLYRLPSSPGDAINTLAVSTNGDITAGGLRSGQAFVLRLTQAGRPASRFPNPVSVGAPLLTGNVSYTSVDRILLDPAGRLLAAVTLGGGSNIAALGTAIFRLTPSLLPDTTFGGSAALPGGMLISPALTVDPQTALDSSVTTDVLQRNYASLGRGPTTLSAGRVFAVAPRPLAGGSGIGGADAAVALQAASYREDFTDPAVTALTSRTQRIRRGASLTTSVSVRFNATVPVSGSFTLEYVLTGPDGSVQRVVPAGRQSVRNLAPGTTRLFSARAILPRDLDPLLYTLSVRLVPTPTAGLPNDRTDNDQSPATPLTVTT